MSEATQGKVWLGADLVGKWLYFRPNGLGRGRWPHRVERHFVQAVRGDTVLDLSPTARPVGWPTRMMLSDLEVVLVQTREEEVASRGPGDTRAGDERRMDWLQVLHRNGHLLGMVQRLPDAATAPDLRELVDAWAAPPEPAARVGP